MNPSRWRLLLLGLCGLAALASIGAVVTQTSFAPLAGTFGWQLASTGRGNGAYIIRVVGEDRGAGAFRSGVRVGDSFDLRDYTPPDRWDLIVAPLAGHAVLLRVTRNGRERSILVRPTLNRWTWDQWVALVALLWILIFAAFIAWRKPEMPDARWVSAILSAMVLGSQLTNIESPWMGLNAVLTTVGASLILIVNVLFVLFASTFGRPIGMLRRWLPVVLYVLTAAIVVHNVSDGLLVWFTPAITTVSLFLAVRLIWNVGAPLAEFVTILCGAFAIAAARGAERQRAAWFLGTLCAFLGMELVSALVQVLTYGNIAALHAVEVLSNAIVVLTPIGLTYAVLNKRLLDVGFILNRTAVFAGVSIVVVGAFVLLEWGLSRWLAGANRLPGVAANLGLVLVLGFSLRFIHNRVDLFVDRVFFRRRHENEEALRRFAREAAFITDFDTLVDRTIAEIQARTDAANADILLHEGGAYRSLRTPSTSIDANDPAVLALRTWHEPVDLHRYATAIDGEIAFPMLARGDVRGILVCGTKRGGETYAPDERGALATLANGAGAAIDALGSADHDLQRSILEELRLLAGDVRRALQSGSSQA